MSWDKEYKSHGRLWGKGPSILGSVAADYLEKHRPEQRLEILDIGCGYGRDACHVAGAFDYRVTGIDTSEKAIAIARDEAAAKGLANVEFECRDFRNIDRDRFDVLIISNLYQLLKQKERDELRNATAKALKTGALLFLSTLSISDPEHYGQGTPVAGEHNSFDDGKFLHFCTREELIADFAFLDIQELYEQEYDEPRANGEIHHHISWVVAGENVDKT
jgi:cyclopropane fatty-acyl-phospholipid synthase-like methyltransferase